MKRFTYLFSLTTVAFFLAFTVFTGCEGPAGVAGIDANETCTVCHNDNSGLLAKQVQHSNSGHMTGGNFERSDADCAACHTHEGFMDRMESGEMEAIADIKNPTPPNCRTCHMIHSAYDSTDWTLTYTDPVELWVNGVTVDVGAGNLCAQEHHANPVGLCTTECIERELDRVFSFAWRDDWLSVGQGVIVFITVVCGCSNLCPASTVECVGVADGAAAVLGERVSRWDAK